MVYKYNNYLINDINFMYIDYFCSQINFIMNKKLKETQKKITKNEFKDVILKDFRLISF